MTEFKIGDRVIGCEHMPFIIAEMSANHNGDLNRALELVKVAALAGVDAIKLQTYNADSITIDHKGGLFDITDKNSLWYGKNLYDLYQEAAMPYEWHAKLFEYAKSLGVIMFSSPFDEAAVDFLEALGAPAYKIASFESNHFPLLEKVASTNKPILISSGTSNINELYESIQCLKNAGAKDIIIFKCTSTYPACPKNSNLVTIPVLQSIFPDCIIGLSDHTPGIGAAIASVALGGRVIEKHFTLSRDDGGVDSAFSLEPHELKNLVTEVRTAASALGQIQLQSQTSEIKSRQFKRSIYIVQDMKEGDIFTHESIRVIRPGDGMSPKYFNQLIGKRICQDAKRGTKMSFDLVLNS